MTGSTRMTDLLGQLAPWRDRLAAHPLYGHLAGIADVRVFMSYHVYAVWDFMALLKALQLHLTNIQSQWAPTGSARIRRLINEMVLEEESDEIDGVATSHFELYRAAMVEAGADVGQVDDFLACLEAGADVDAAMAACGAPAGARAFVRNTFETIATGKPHVITASFALGREDLIPRMFGPIVRSLCGGAHPLSLFELYLNRHIQLDGDAHGSMARAMMGELCGEDPRRWEEATEGAAHALVARIALWDAVDSALPVKASSSGQAGPEPVSLSR